MIKHKSGNSELNSRLNQVKFYLTKVFKFIKNDFYMQQVEWNHQRLQLTGQNINVQTSPSVFLSALPFSKEILKMVLFKTNTVQIEKHYLGFNSDNNLSKVMSVFQELQNFRIEVLNVT